MSAFLIFLHSNDIINVKDFKWCSTFSMNAHILFILIWFYSGFFLSSQWISWENRVVPSCMSAIGVVTQRRHNERVRRKKNRDKIRRNMRSHENMSQHMRIIKKRTQEASSHTKKFKMKRKKTTKKKTQEEGYHTNVLRFHFLCFTNE